LELGVDVVIAGGGLAGAATAFFLSRTRGVRVLLLEQERELAVHSSGRNAGLVRRASGEAFLDAMSCEGADFIAAPPADFPGPLPFRRTGSFLLVPPDEAARFAVAGARVVDAAEVARRVPPFRVDRALAAIRADGDGVVEPWALLHGFVRGAQARGVELRLGVMVRAVHVRGGRVAEVELDGGARIPCRVVVDAAGAWAGPLAVAAGIADPGLTPIRRHLLVTATDARVDPAWPWIWDTVNGFYFRPETGGLLLCSCDEAADAPGSCVADPQIAAEVAAKVERWLPELAGLRVAKLWAGHRTRRANHRFLVDEERSRRGFVWAAGLGGHGVTCAAAVGRCVAAATLRALGEAAHAGA
jgi:glycine/D-amino acid oxidase-like deaminating enzyme